MATKSKIKAPSRKAGPLFGGMYAKKKVFVSGHTGFKGAWLCEWLVGLGARVTGFSLPPPGEPSLFEQAGLAARLEHNEGDIRDAEGLTRVVQQAQPDFIFHLAAQSLVRESYREPVVTYATNVLGTIHLLEAARTLKKPCAVVCITTDKCYENREWVHGYREEDPLGGYDPYSSSKAAAEIAIASWRRSFLKEHPVKVASARAGNVIGGGDWAQDRILPDCIRALRQGRSIPVRNPRATRPWQHVLEPLSGYLWLAAKLAQTSKQNSPFAAAFNFGPLHDANRTVGEFVSEVLKNWPGRWDDCSDPKAVHEAGLLRLSIDKASAMLGWSPVWNFPTTIAQAVAWYRQADRKLPAAAIRKLTADQISRYVAAARAAGLPWTAGGITA